MKRILFFLLGLLIPVFIRVWLYDFIGSTDIMWPLAVILQFAPLVFIFALPILIGGIIMSIYGFKDKPIIYAYFGGVAIGIVLVFTLISNWEIVKTYL